jgi:anti-sigma regulatory factor (Ser/Thr protein kinase)
MGCVCWTAKSQSANEATTIRRSIAQYLEKRINEREALLEAEIVIGELIANALRHSPGPVCADIEWRNDNRAVLTVHDSGESFEQPRAVNNAFAESGRGLHIVRALADDVRIERVEPRGCVATATLRLTKHADARSGPTPCPRGERRSELGCACALEVHGQGTSGANVDSLARTD